MAVGLGKYDVRAGVVAVNALREGLPPLPDRMKHLPIDERGYPVPYFVAWVDGQPDHRAMDAAKFKRAIGNPVCWMCGGLLGRFKSFCIGPMCAITRSISEPPSHRDCLRYAVKVCPFMTRPMAKRREANLPDDRVEAAGDGIKRNPGATCIWTTKTFKPFRVSNGILFEIGDPSATEWYAEGRPATRAEVDASIESGLALLYEPALREDRERPGAGAVADLERRIAHERAWLDGQVWPPERL